MECTLKACSKCPALFSMYFFCKAWKSMYLLLNFSHSFVFTTNCFCITVQMRFLGLADIRKFAMVDG